MRPGDFADQDAAQAIPRKAKPTDSHRRLTPRHPDGFMGAQTIPHFE
ncbi:hypothetical protein EIO_0441 [Ketogulonicigenium vulgare Y25]|uniref:Uncharacterized protein n=1 Tax=Ketogulonicigenium vulgare (strain WSH-001) TaxID=759362 RepID=F9Y779_KETVW|nr:hypothetical protein EIO_0441 [Ketogulonicigenium vulgare Y25]AEM39846.1 hypothetical protein KVU_0007 [Ketogulonicigenium vulgare WSH-001]ALJ82220.1 hypothetical protein KVH_02050 [Ketogulonicigenium vulgare]AOZ53536.1 hypothetical protein KVC_0511 [Ketogulonicigenium vulgare]